jgi:hypothetical protein
MQEIAKNLPSSTWDEVQEALVNKKVERQYAVLAKDFDARLEAKVQDLISTYGSASDQLKAKAQKHALEIRNTILNLSCPHCHIAYAEFTGCMALQCKSCEGHFCAYCHLQFSTGRGAHDHVRQCLMNKTTNSSYYASPEEIENAQRRYRTRELRKCLQQHKKELQNAIVIELEADLGDLGIQPAALFEFGNLQGEINEL